jgi:hypothetical protein
VHSDKRCCNSLQDSFIFVRCVNRAVKLYLDKNYKNVIRVNFSSITMTSPIKPWEANSLQNSTQIRRCATNNIRDIPATTRSAPVLPPLPRNSPISSPGYNSYMPYSNGESKVHKEKNQLSFKKQHQPEIS